MNIDPIGVLETGPRKMRSGHIIRQKHHHGFFTAYCDGKGCNWSMTVLLDDREIADYQAFRHRTEPRLLLPGSSDMLRPTRMQALGELLRRGKL